MFAFCRYMMRNHRGFGGVWMGRKLAAQNRASSRRRVTRFVCFKSVGKILASRGFVWRVKMTTQPRYMA